jgi:hypothetical protein
MMDDIRAEFERSLELFMAFLPNVLGAVGLFFLGLILARVISEFVRKRIDNSKFGIAANRDALTPGSPSLGKSLGSALFWFILLLFIAPILTTLGLAETLAPLTSMLVTVMEFLPRIAGAIFIVVIGYLIAMIARRAVQSILAAAPIDHAAKQAAIGDLIKGTEIANAAGLIVFALILIPAIIAGLDALAIESITEPATRMLQTMLNAIPNIIAAVIVLSLFTLFARALRAFTISFLSGMGFDNFWRHLGLAIEHREDAGTETPLKTAGITPTVVVANIAMAAMLIVGAITAAQQLNIEPVSTALSQILSVGGQILLGSIVIIAGIPIGRFVANTIRRAGDARTVLVATVVQWGIMVLVTAIGIREMGLGEDIIFAGFVLILGAASLAGALAFGIGGRGAAARFLERLDRDQPD